MLAGASKPSSDNYNSNNYDFIEQGADGCLNVRDSHSRIVRQISVCKEGDMISVCKEGDMMRVANDALWGDIPHLLDLPEHGHRCQGPDLDGGACAQNWGRRSSSSTFM